MVVFKVCSRVLLAMHTVVFDPSPLRPFIPLETQQVENLFNCWNSNGSLFFQCQATDGGLLRYEQGFLLAMHTVYLSTPPSWGFGDETQPVENAKWQEANLLALYKSWTRE